MPSVRVFCVFFAAHALAAGCTNDYDDLAYRPEDADGSVRLRHMQIGFTIRQDDERSGDEGLARQVLARTVVVVHEHVILVEHLELVLMQELGGTICKSDVALRAEHPIALVRFAIDARDAAETSRAEVVDVVDLDADARLY